ncbi:L-seryl-tRNA(Sec) selenium transferase [Evansella sp. AB-P1]|uniref:L-seryl-tRNA(Sec) selenium transferase n=1 Tax=Evansella sp. AB-P1 TaxID=3037653 RepID=UPI00241CFA4E|nr:L-seryl-tRNA(Sec) selenium transferase [Evansella sp. AB-P1]MDG5789602.1 L-seryl-tRNA(Sec) selenium transferase [Evansella sp. AB-P1]
MMVLIRNIPAVHEIQQTEVYVELLHNKHIPDLIVKGWIKECLSTLRKDILDDNEKYNDYSRNDFILLVCDHLLKKSDSYYEYNLRTVLNGTGTILHTNLGRARLSEAAIKRVVETSSYYSTLEYNVAEGKRGSRHDIIQDLLAKATNSEAAMVVNNNAAAVYLVLKCLGKGKEVIVSRGELVEIGGSFRVSTIMEESGATLVEVGTTNKTHPYDYEQAITPETGMLMKVHTSNFKTVGFTKDVSTAELKEIASSVMESNETSTNSIIIYEDLGSGSLYPFKHDGIGDEPVVKEALKHGADIVSFSGDKLLGGPQAGIIAGKKSIIDKLKKHPLARVLRVDKMTLAALEATLQSYVYGENVRDIPTIRDILQTKDEIKNKVHVFLDKLPDLSSLWKVEVTEATSQVGGGTMPTVEQDSVGVKITYEGISTSKLEKMFRKISIPVITRVVEDSVFIDFRTIAIDEIPLLHTSFLEVDEQAKKLHTSH